MSDNWVVQKLEDFVVFRNGKSIKAGTDGAYPVYGSNGVIGSSDQYMYENAIVLGRVGAYCGSVERCHGRFWASDNTIVVEVEGNQANTQYVYYLLNHARLNQHAGGAAQPLLTQSRLKPLKFALPPLAIQERIASILSAYDDLIENNTRRIAILEEMAQRLYEEWFVNFRFPGHEEVEFEGDLPKGWREAIVEDFGRVVTGKTPTKSRDEFFGGDIPFVRLPDMHGNVFVTSTTDTLSALGADSQKEKAIPAGSLCVSCIGTVGIVVLTSEICQTNQQINSLVPHDPRSREFLFFALRSLKDTIERYAATGATMANLSRGKFAALTLTQPSEETVGQFHQITSPMIDGVLNLQRKNTNLRAQRDLLLSKLVSGEIDVSSAEVEMEAAE